MKSKLLTLGFVLILSALIVSGCVPFVIEPWTLDESVQHQSTRKGGKK